jgi:HlyD family secretion protein
VSAVTTNPILKAPGARLILIVSAIALAFTGLTFFLLTNPIGGKPKAAETSQATDKAAVGGIGALGRLEPEGEVFKVAPPAVGLSSRVAKLLVREGDQVKLGQPIAVMDSFESLQAAGMQSEAQVREAEANLAQVKAGAKIGDVNAQRATVLQAKSDWQRAKAEKSSADLELQKVKAAAVTVNADYQKAKLDYDRYAKLFKDQAISKSALEAREITLITERQKAEQGLQTIFQAETLVAQRQADVDRIELTIAEAEQRLGSVAEVRPTDVKQAEEQVRSAIAGVQKAKADFDNAVVKSPIDGRVLKVYAKDNEAVGTNGIMEIGRTSQMYAVAEVDENLVARIREGQVATVKSDAFEGEITGKVVKIGQKIGKNSITSTDPKDSQDTRVVEVKIKLDNSQPVAGLTNLQVRVSIQP